MAIQPDIKDSVEIEDPSLAASETPSILPENVKKKIIYIGGAVGAFVLIAFGIMFYKNMQEGKQEEASLALSRVQPFYEAGDFQKALDGGQATTGRTVKGLKAIVAEFDGTEPGKLAALYAGNMLVQQNNYTEAARYYSIAEDADADLTRIGGLAGQAAVKDKAGQYKEAAGLYKQAAELAETTGNKEFYQLSAALLYEKANDKNEALKLYREIVASNEFSEFAGDAKAGILRLGERLE